MTKIEILRFIEVNKIIEDSKRINNVINSKLYQGFIKDDAYIRWFIGRDRVQKDFDILKEEIEEVLSKVNSSEDVIRNLSLRCNHDVRLKKHNLFGLCYKCVFCGKNIVSDNYVSWEDSINRNRHSVTLDSNVDCDEDGYEDFLPYGYSINQVYDLIMGCLEGKELDQKVDLVNEFKKLNLSNCVIRDEKFINEDYILIVCGSNKESLLCDGYISRDYDDEVCVKFLEYFRDMLNTKLCFISSEDISKFNINKKNNLKVIQYSNLDSLLKILEDVKEIPFKCVIDFSNLFTYSIVSNSVEIENYNINFNEILPNSLYFRCVMGDDGIKLVGSEKSISGDVNEICNNVRKLVRNRN